MLTEYITDMDTMDTYLDIETYTYNQQMGILITGTLLITYILTSLCSRKNDENDEFLTNMRSMKLIEGNYQSFIRKLVAENKELNKKVIILIDQMETLQRHMTMANTVCAEHKKYERENINLSDKIDSHEKLIEALTIELEDQRIVNETQKRRLVNYSLESDKNQILKDMSIDEESCNDDPDDDSDDDSDPDYKPFSKLREAMRYMTVAQLKSRTTNGDISTISKKDGTLTKEDYISAFLETKARLAFENDFFNDNYLKERIIIDSQQYIDDNIDEIAQEWTLFLEQRRSLYG